jgi:hypothetical protein
MSGQVKPLIINDRALEALMRAHSQGWEVYAAVYRQINQILTASPTIVLEGECRAPSLKLEDLLQALKNQFIFDEDLLTADRVKQLAMIWSYKRRKVITSEYFTTSLEIPLLIAILDEAGAFKEGE